MKRHDVLAGALAAAAAAQAAPLRAQGDALKALIDAAKAEGSVVVDGPPIDEPHEVRPGEGRVQKILRGSTVVRAGAGRRPPGKQATSPPRNASMMSSWGCCGSSG